MQQERIGHRRPVAVLGPIGSGNQSSSRPLPPGRSIHSPSCQPIAVSPSASWCCTAHAGPAVPCVATWISSATCSWRHRWSASKPVRPGLIAAPTISAAPCLGRNRRGRPASCTSSMSADIDTTETPAARYSSASCACGCGWHRATTSVTARSVGIADLDRPADRCGCGGIEHGDTNLLIEQLARDAPTGDSIPDQPDDRRQRVRMAS